MAKLVRRTIDILLYAPPAAGATKTDNRPIARKRVWTLLPADVEPIFAVCIHPLRPIRKIRRKKR